MIAGKDNNLLVEFEFVIDLDLALFKFIKANYKSSPYINGEFIKLRDEREIIWNTLNRSHINLLEYLIPDMDSTNMYLDIMNNPDNYKELLKYAKAYDTFGLMVTFLKEASSVAIDILCKDETEEAFIKKLNPIMPTIVSSKQNINLAPYTALYVKYFPYLIQYGSFDKKHIYLPNARYNYEEGKDCLNMTMVTLYGGINDIALMDMYTHTKFRMPTEEESE